MDCCIIPALEALKTTDDPAESLRLRRYLAVNIGDRESLRILLGVDPEEFARFYPDMAARELSTEDTIDSFLQKFSPENDSDSQDSVPAAAAASDYASDVLAELPEIGPADGIPVIDNIPSATDGEMKPEPTLHTDDYQLPEARAASLVKERRYSEALDIITFLRTQYPAKAYYMDDQIRFLRKLIENSRS